MAIISTNDVVAGLKKGATWGTEPDMTSGGINLYASNITVNAAFGDFLARDFGQGGKRTNNARLALNASVSITCDVTYGQAWLALFAGVAGTESSPSEQTGSQTDYLTTHDIADSIFGLFWNLAYSIETDRTIAIYSMKVTSFSYQQGVNNAGSITFNCIADRVVEGSQNTVAEITALTDYAYETATMGGTNHYFRIDSYSVGTALTSGDDKTITNIAFSLSRPMQPRFGLRGANTAYTLEPVQVGPIEATLTVTMSELDNATYDMLTQWSTPGFLMAEYFIDGSQIGTGVNRSLKWQFPYLKVTGQFPAGHDVPNNATLLNPSITYHMLKAPAAPSGMSGVTDLVRLTSIGPTRSTKWTA